MPLSEERIPASHPLKRIRKLAIQAPDRLNPAICRLYALEGRPSVPAEQLPHNLLFCWFVGLSPNDPILHPTTDGIRPNSATPKNHHRILHDDLIELFVETLMAAPEVQPLLGDEPFSGNCTLVQAWATHACLKRIDGRTSRHVGYASSNWAGKTT